MDKNAHLHQLCKTKKAYFDLWEAGKGPGQKAATSESPKKDNKTKDDPKECVSRESARREAICRACERWDKKDEKNPDPSEGCNICKSCEKKGLVQALWKRPHAKCLQADPARGINGPDKWEDTRKKLILHFRLSPGDTLTGTVAVESLHAAYPNQFITDVRTGTPAIFENNPHITKLEDAEGEHLDLNYPLIHQSNQKLTHFLNGYTLDLGTHLKLPLTPTVCRPVLYLSDDEKKWTNQVKDAWAEQLAGRDIPFWIINAGVKADFTAKQWPLEYFQTVVDRTHGKIQWVQIGEAQHDHQPLRGVLDLRGKTDQRQLIRLVYHAQGGLGPTTYLQHLMAAFEKPYICLLGGREPVNWVQYKTQVTMHTIGSLRLDCCRTAACWKSRVVPGKTEDLKNKSLCLHPVLGLARPVAKCMAMIRPEEVLSALERMAA